MRTIVLLIVVSLFLSSCKKEETTIINVGIEGGPVNFQNLQSNQVSRYVQYQGTCQNEDDFAFSGNQIFLEVKENANGMFFKETLTADSPMNNTGNPISQLYEVIPHENYLLIPDRSLSYLFWFYANDTIWTDPVHDVDLVQEGCFLIQDGTPFIGNDIAFVESFQWGDFHMQDLTAVSCEPMGELDGYLFYDRNGLHNSYVLQFGFLEEEIFINGWLRD